MAEKMTFENFSKGLDSFTDSFVKAMHRTLMEKGYKAEIKPAAQGPVVSYLTPKRKKTVFNYVFRKSGMHVRIYGDNVHKYQEFLQALPNDMILAMDKAGVCRQCNARCPKGYPVTINDNETVKCRYNAFLFAVNPETAPFIKTFIENEIAERDKNLGI